MILRVLLIEPNLEYALFLQDAFSEIEALYPFRDWSRIDLEHVWAWPDAETMLLREPPGAVLLDLSSPPGPEASESGARIFRRLQAAAPEVPVILLAASGEESLALRLLREGAQDFLLKNEVDCLPLACALRHAIARHHFLRAACASARADSLTGLSNRAGFLAMAERDLKLAESLSRRWMLLLARPRDLAGIENAFGDQRRDLELVRSADSLRGLAGPAQLAARLGPDLFAISLFETAAEPLEQAAARLRASLLDHGMDSSASLFDPSRPQTLDAMLDQAEQNLAILPEPAGPRQRSAGAG